MIYEQLRSVTLQGDPQWASQRAFQSRSGNPEKSSKLSLELFTIKIKML